MAHSNILLVGPMGAGKTTIGRMVARQLDWRFCDVDHAIEARAGADIPWIFDLEGEAGFRDRESQVLADLAAGQQQVIATGGGAVLRPQNRAVLADCGWVVYLMVDVATQLRRTANDRNRPLLQKADPERVLRALSRERDPLYREVADRILATDRDRPRQLAGLIAEEYQHACSPT